MNRKLKLFGVFAIGGTLLAGAVGSAAALTVNGGTAQTGNASATCDPDGVDVSYTVSAGNITDVTVSGIHADCIGATLSVTVNNGVDGVGSTTIAAGSETVDIAPDVSVAAASSVDVTIIDD